MPLVGLCGEPKEALEKLNTWYRRFPCRNSSRKKSQSGRKKAGRQNFADHGKSAEALEALDCLIWSGSCENVLSEEVDSLLEEYPRLAVIFVADSPDAVFDALTKPFSMWCGDMRWNRI